jgi:hypothetical protein
MSQLLGNTVVNCENPNLTITIHTPVLQRERVVYCSGRASRNHRAVITAITPYAWGASEVRIHHI